MTSAAWFGCSATPWRPYDDDFKEAGGGASINARFNLTAGTRLLMQSAFGSGLGRYIGGLVPDAAFRRDGSISTIGTTSWVVGVEQRISPRLSLAGYYSGVDTDANFDLDTDGSHIGFGYPGASDSNNRTIQEVTGTGSYQFLRSLTAVRDSSTCRSPGSRENPFRKETDWRPPTPSCSLPRFATTCHEVSEHEPTT